MSKFKIGDEVRVIKTGENKTDAPAETLGKTGTILKINGCGRSYGVGIKDEKDERYIHIWWYRDDQIELVEEDIGLITKVEDWAIDRDLHTQDPAKQYMKFAEEAGELAESIIKQDECGIEDAFGDVLVTLIILNQQLNVQRVIDGSLEDWLRVAWDEIKGK